jgi:hypothetical protein
MTGACMMFHLNGNYLLWVQTVTLEWLSPKIRKKVVTLISPIPYYGYMKYLYLLFSDEEIYHINEHMSRQNCHLWGCKNSHIVVEHKTVSIKVNVLCATAHSKVIEPFFVEDTISMLEL